LLTFLDMQGPIRCVLVAGLLCGCPGSDFDTPVDANPDAIGSGGLVVAWSSQPDSWPGSLGDGVTLERAEFAFDNLRVIGDAGPGDPRTTASAFNLRWDSGTKPDTIQFSDAPAGLYSQVSMSIDGHVTNDTFELRGHVLLGSTDWEYRIEDTAPLELTVAIDKTLTPPGVATVLLRINFQHALDVVDFATLDVDDGKLELENGDSQMAAFRAALVESFEIVSGGGGAGTPLR
jgi:hypothetical protein